MKKRSLAAAALFLLISALFLDTQNRLGNVVLRYQLADLERLYPATELIRRLEEIKNTNDTEVRFLATEGFWRGSQHIVFSLPFFNGYDSLTRSWVTNIQHALAGGEIHDYARRAIWSTNPDFELGYLRDELLGRFGITHVVVKPDRPLGRYIVSDLLSTINGSDTAIPIHAEFDDEGQLSLLAYQAWSGRITLVQAKGSRSLVLPLTPIEKVVRVRGDSASGSFRVLAYHPHTGSVRLFSGEDGRLLHTVPTAIASSRIIPIAIEGRGDKVFALYDPTTGRLSTFDVEGSTEHFELEPGYAPLAIAVMDQNRTRLFVQVAEGRAIHTLDVGPMPTKVQKWVEFGKLIERLNRAASPARQNAPGGNLFYTGAFSPALDIRLSRPITAVPTAFPVTVRSGEFVDAALFNEVERTIYIRKNSASAVRIHASEEGDIWAVKDPLPPAYLVRGVVAVGSDLEALERYFDPRWNPYCGAILVLPLAVETETGTCGTTGRILSLKKNANRVDLLVDTETNSRLVLNMTYAEGWRARINGRAIPIDRSNHGFMSVPVGSGRSTVELTYEPWSFNAGSVISVSTLIVLFSLLAYRRIWSNGRSDG